MRHTTEEIIRILRPADGVKTVEEACREACICRLLCRFDQAGDVAALSCAETFYRWRRK